MKFVFNIPSYPRLRKSPSQKQDLQGIEPSCREYDIINHSEDYHGPQPNIQSFLAYDCCIDGHRLGWDRYSIQFLRTDPVAALVVLCICRRCLHWDNAPGIGLPESPFPQQATSQRQGDGPAGLVGGDLRCHPVVVELRSSPQF
jgi:hypothetical protein